MTSACHLSTVFKGFMYVQVVKYVCFIIFYLTENNTPSNKRCLISKVGLKQKTELILSYSCKKHIWIKAKKSLQNLYSNDILIF